MSSFELRLHIVVVFSRESSAIVGVNGIAPSLLKRWECVALDHVILKGPPLDTFAKVIN